MLSSLSRSHNIVPPNHTLAFLCLSHLPKKDNRDAVLSYHGSTIRFYRQVHSVERERECVEDDDINVRHREEQRRETHCEGRLLSFSEDSMSRFKFNYA